MRKLLLLHGALGSTDQLLPLSQTLAGHYDVHILNFSGHGGEEMPAHFSIRHFAGNVLDYLDVNRIDKISLFGYSMGGYVAMYLARESPSRVDKIITLGTKFEWNEEIAAKEIKMLDPMKIQAKVPAFASLLERRHGLNWKKVLALTGELMSDLGKKDILPLKEFAIIHHPSLLLLGEMDNMITYEETMAVQRAMPNGSFAYLADTAHPIEQADPVRLGAVIRNFLG